MKNVRIKIAVYVIGLLIILILFSTNTYSVKCTDINFSGNELHLEKNEITAWLQFEFNNHSIKNTVIKYGQNNDGVYFIMDKKKYEILLPDSIVLKPLESKKVYYTSLEPVLIVESKTQNFDMGTDFLLLEKKKEIKVYYQDNGHNMYKILKIL